MNEGKIIGVNIFKLDGSTMFFKCSSYEMCRMVDEVRLFREDGTLIAQFFARNIAGFSVRYEGDISGEPILMACMED